MTKEQICLLTKRIDNITRYCPYKGTMYKIEYRNLRRYLYNNKDKRVEKFRTKPEIMACIL